VFANEPEPTNEPAFASDALCTATANIWVHATALDMIGAPASPELNRVAMANVAEWLERATLFDDPLTSQRRLMFEAFIELQSIVESGYDYDWQTFNQSSDYATADAAAVYERELAALTPFVDEQCQLVETTALQADAEARAAELETEFATAPSTIVESASLPGHAIFSHSSGRLIASFPVAWDYEERGGAIADLIASPDIESFLNGDAIDGVHFQLVEAATVDDFRGHLERTRTGESCLRTNNITDDASARLDITQSFACSDHSASLIGQYDAGSGIGLIIEASFDRVDASRADLIRLASISNSVLWS